MRKSAKDVIKLINNSSLAKKEAGYSGGPEYDKLPEWKKQTVAIKKKLNGHKWNPMKKLSRSEMESIRFLKSQFSNLSASDLGHQFKVSPEVIRRILKSKWQPNEDEMVKIQHRWKKRGLRIHEMYETDGIADSSLPIRVEKTIVIGQGRNNNGFTVNSTLPTHAMNSDQPYNNKYLNKQFKNEKRRKSKLFLLKESSTL